MRRRSCFLCWLLFCTVAVPAQDDVVVTDSVITGIGSVVEEKFGENYFDTVGHLTPVVVRNVPQSLIDSLQGADDFWYAAVERKKQKVQAQNEQPASRSLFQQQWFRNFLWLVILGSFCGVVLWYLVSSNILLFRKKAKAIGSYKDNENDSENIFERDYEKEIAEATEGNNYRLAIRLLYLRTLKSLSTRGLIHYRVGRTNQDYVADLRTKPQYRDFFRLTRNFEYIWYGQFPLSAETFRHLQADFLHFKNSLPS